MTPKRIALVYFVVAGLWILFSDWTLQLLLADITELTRWQTLKGCFFVAGSSLIVYALARRQQTQMQHQLTLKRRHLSAIRRKAYTDYLTSLPNRRFGLRVIRQLIQRSRQEQTPFCVLFLDLDNFKQINDTLGHSVGDRVIITVGLRLQEGLRNGEQLIRHGGNEFLILCESLANQEAASKRASEVLEIFSAPVTVGAMPLRVTASIGVSCFPEHGTSLGPLLRSADLALQHSKKYKNCFKFYQADMGKAMRYRFELEQKLRQAVDEHQLQVYYQPIYDPALQKFTGAEALLRWPGPEGFISPADFIPVAEQCGKIRELGAMVLMRAARETQQLSESLGRPLSISVNVSPKQFANGHILQDLRTALDFSGIDPACVILEITEGVFLSNIIETGEVLNQTVELGVALSMDDFGQGYSSLSYLRKHPFSYLKIDQSFVQGMDQSPQDRALVEASVAMAVALDLKVIGEGVETETQKAALTVLGVHYLQGFHLAYPMPLKDYQRFMAEQDAMQIDD